MIQKMTYLRVHDGKLELPESVRRAIGWHGEEYVACEQRGHELVFRLMSVDEAHEIEMDQWAEAALKIAGTGLEPEDFSDWPGYRDPPNWSAEDKAGSDG